MKIREKDTWEDWKESNKDPYGQNIINYAVKWADLMEERLSEGEELEEIAKPTSHEADDMGITGFMYGQAVLVLSDVWKYGERLLRWHNRKYQVDGRGDEYTEEGSVINPAMINTKLG